MMDKERFAELKADIAKHGLQEPIKIHDGKILDGRNRYKACHELGIEALTTPYDGTSPWCYVWSRNAQRRDLSSAEQRAAIFLDMESHIEKELKAVGKQVKEEADQKRSEAAQERPRDDKGRLQSSAPSNRGQTGKKQAKRTRGTAAKLAETAGVSRSALERQRTLRNKDIELSRKVAAGDMKPTEAMRQLKRNQIMARGIPSTQRANIASSTPMCHGTTAPVRCRTTTVRLATIIRQ